MRYLEAKAITGTLSNTSKMPGKSWGIPAVHGHWVEDFAKKHNLKVPAKYGCPVGAKLHGIVGSVCRRCYVQKGNYTYPNARKGMINRLNGYAHPQWVEAMALMIITESIEDYFRWFDAGDLLDKEMLTKICRVCKLTPTINHWLPTREITLLKKFDKKLIPNNLTIRVSAPMVGQKPIAGKYTSTVYSYRKGDEIFGEECLAYAKKGTDKGKCGDCRACWTFEGNITYRAH